MGALQNRPGNDSDLGARLNTMAWQLIYTSAPRLLDAGRSGFGTVARPRQMRALLTAAVERVSQFNRMPGFDEARIIYSHRHITIGGTRYSVLTRIRSAGADYTKRTNHIAHHIIVEQREIAALGPNGPTPVDVLLSADWRDRWDEPPIYLEDELPIASISRRCALPAQWWEAMTGSRRRAALLTAPDAVRGCYIAWENDPTGDPYQTAPLCLFGESLLLRPDRAWDTTFTTNLQPSDEPSDFHWRGMLADSPLRPQAEQSGRPMFSVAAHSLLDTPTGELADLAELGVRKVTPHHFAVQHAPLPAPHEEYPQASSQAAEPGYEAPSRPQTAGPQPRQQPKQDKQEPHKRSKWRALLIPGLAITAILIIVSACIFWSHKKQQEKRDEMVGDLALSIEKFPPFRDRLQPIEATELKKQLLERNESIGIDELGAFCKNAKNLGSIWEKSESGGAEDAATVQQAIDLFHQRGNVKPADRMDRWAELLAARLKVCAALKDKGATVKYLQEHSQDQADKLEAFAQNFTTVSNAASTETIPEADIGKVKAAINGLDDEKFELPTNLKKVKEALFTQKMDMLQPSHVAPKPIVAATPTPAPKISPAVTPAPESARLFPCRTYILSTNKQLSYIELPAAADEQFTLSICKDFDKTTPLKLIRNEKAFRTSMTQEAPAVELMEPTKLAAGNGAPQNNYLLLGSSSDAQKFQAYVFNRPTSSQDAPLLHDIIKDGFERTNSTCVFGLNTNIRPSLEDLCLVGSQKLNVAYADGSQRNFSFDSTNRRLDFSAAAKQLNFQLEGDRKKVANLKAEAEKLAAEINTVKSQSTNLLQFGAKLLGLTDSNDPLYCFKTDSDDVRKNGIYKEFQKHLAKLHGVIKTRVKVNDNEQDAISVSSNSSADLEKVGQRFQEKLLELQKKFAANAQATDKKVKDAAQANLSTITQYQNVWNELRKGIPEPALTNLLEPEKFAATAAAQIAKNTKEQENCERRIREYNANPLLNGKIPPGTYRIVIEEQGEKYYCIPLVEITQTPDTK